MLYVESKEEEKIMKEIHIQRIPTVRIKKHCPMWKITFEYDCVISLQHLYRMFGVCTLYICYICVNEKVSVYMARGTGLTRLILSHAIFQAAQNTTKNHFWCSIFYDDVSWL